MNVTWYGGWCIAVEEKVRGEEAKSVLFFPHTKTSRARTLEEKANVIVAEAGARVGVSPAFRIQGPGEYDVAGFAMRGVEIRPEGSEKGKYITVYVVDAGDMTLAYVSGSVVGRLRDQDLEALADVDSVIVSVPFREKGSDPVAGLSEFIRAIEPHVVVVLASDAKAKTAAKKELGTDAESVARYAVAEKDFPEEGFRVVFLDAQ